MAWYDSPAHLYKGHFGKVSLYCYDPTNDGTGEMVAVKALKEGCGPQLRSGWQREIEILRTLYHEHIVKYKGCCEDQGVHGGLPWCVGLAVPSGTSEEHATLGWRWELSWPDQLERLTPRGGVAGQPSQLGGGLGIWNEQIQMGPYHSNRVPRGS